MVSTSDLGATIKAAQFNHKQPVRQTQMPLFIADQVGSHRMVSTTKPIVKKTTPRPTLKEVSQELPGISSAHQYVNQIQNNIFCNSIRNMNKQSN